MTKRKPDKVIEYRISLQDKQSDQLDSLIVALQFNRVTTGVGSVLEGLGIPEIAKQMKDPIEMVGVFYSIAMVLEFLGIETGLPTPADFDGWYAEYLRRRVERPDEPRAGTLAMIVKDMLVNLFGIGPDPFGYGFGNASSVEPGRAPGTATGGVE